jgi:putative hydrolase of the HAD superfamily
MAVFWDFDATLAYRKGFFVETLVKILEEYIPGSNVKIQDLRPHLKYPFPWQHPEKPHLELSEPEAWWAGIIATFQQAFAAVGVEENKAAELAKLSRYRYIEPQGFILYDDTIQALAYLRDRGWKQYILSNHVPELPRIVEGVGLGKFITECISSANVGYEKPHPEIFRIALKLAGNPQIAWMVGDSMDADVRGAEAVGMKSILVRSPRDPEALFYAESLPEAVKIIDPGENEKPHHSL